MDARVSKDSCAEIEKQESSERGEVSEKGSSVESHRRPRRVAAVDACWRTKVLFDPKGSKGGVCRNLCK